MASRLTLLKLGQQPCLHDGSLPGWFAHDERGFPDQRSRRYFWARHVERVGEAFGGRVHGWVPTFEPTRWASRGWLDGDRPPGQRDDARGFAAAVEEITLHFSGRDPSRVAPEPVEIPLSAHAPASLRIEWRQGAPRYAAVISAAAESTG